MNNIKIIPYTLEIDQNNKKWHLILHAFRRYIRTEENPNGTGNGRFYLVFDEDDLENPHFVAINNILNDYWYLVDFRDYTWLCYYINDKNYECNMWFPWALSLMKTVIKIVNKAKLEA